MKAVTKAVEGVVNLQKAVAIDPAVSLASATVGGVGQVLSQPGAGAVLGAGLTALGVPGAGLIATALPDASNTPAPARAPEIMAAPYSPPEKSGGIDLNLILIGGAGLLAVIVLALVMGRKGKA